MIVRVGVIGLVLLTAAVLQTSLLPFLALSGFRPDLLLLITIAFALTDGLLSGLRIAFVAGVLTDLLLSASPVGLTALVFLGVAYAVGTARPYLAPDSGTASILLAIGGTAMGVAGYGMLAAMLADDPISLGLVVQATLVSAIYAAFLAPLVTAMVRGLSRQFPTEQGGIA